VHSSLAGKSERANRYARETDRITFERLALEFRGDNDTHNVALDPDGWHCTCHYFESWQTCVHILALQKMLGDMLPEWAQVAPRAPSEAASAGRSPRHRRIAVRISRLIRAYRSRRAAT